MKRLFYLAAILAMTSPACQDSGTRNDEQASENPDDTISSPDLSFKGEKHFSNLRQLTNGGDNAEAYWSFDGSWLVFQVTNSKWDLSCDQIFYFNPFEEDISENKPTMLSTGTGRTTCAYFLPGDSTVLYASTHLGSKNCPPKPAPREDHKYVWPIYSDFDIFVTDLNGKIIKRLTDSPGYDAEATVSPGGDKIVFTSIRSGDLELYTMDVDGKNVKQITNELGYDGGAFFSPDGEKLIFRASRPNTPEEVKEYTTLLNEGLVMPTQMELFICNADGSEMKQLTNLGKANWCPYFHPSGKKIIFSSNHTSERGFPFNLYMINTDGTGLEQITMDETFDAFPVFSPDGRYLIFSSNRNNGGNHDTNLFMAEWVD